MGIDWLPRNAVFKQAGLLLASQSAHSIRIMMKTFLSASAIAFMGMATQAQMVTLEDLDGNQVNGQSVTVVASEPEFLMEYDLVTTLTGSVDKTINVKRYELNVVPTSENYFCWGVCYLPVVSGAKPYWLSVDSVEMTPGVEFTGFHAYYKPQGTSGVAGFRFVFYDIADHDDSTWVDIHFDTQQVGIEELAVDGFSVFPNPARGTDVTIEHALSGSVQGAELVIYDALGSRVFQQAIAGGSARTTIKAGTLPAGFYLATIEQAGRLVATKPLAITAR